MDWFRFYHGALDDPKVQRLPPVLFKHWVNVLCLASLGTPRGRLPGIEAVAFRLRLTPPKTEEVIGELVSAGLVDRDIAGGFSIHNWSGRQRASDDVAERQRRHRGNATSNGDVTLQEPLHVTPKSLSRATEQNRTDTETEQSTPPTPPPATEAAAVPPECESSFSLFCELRTIDGAAMPAATRGKYLGELRRLVAKYGADDVAGCMRWLESWREVPWKPETVGKEIEEWIGENRPTTGRRPPAKSAQGGSLSAVVGRDQGKRYQNGGYLNVRGKAN